MLASFYADEEVLARVGCNGCAIASTAQRDAYVCDIINT